VTSFAIGGRRVGSSQPCYVIAEAGVNHNGERRVAEALIDAAAGAGADAVKFQTFSAARLASRTAPRAEYQAARVADGGTQFDMLERLELSADDHRHLLRYARQRSIEFLSTPFDPQSADLLHELGVAAFKIGSGDLTDALLLARVAACGRPVLLSTGGATLDDVRRALAVIEEHGAPPVALLHCVSTYPARAEDANLRAIGELGRVFHRPVGFSDHTPDCLTPVLAVAAGAAILEKHLTVDRAMPGPDHAFSLEARDFAAMVAEIRRAERALGSGVKQPLPDELPIMRVVRKSLYAARTISRGHAIAADDLVALRPAGGISPMDAKRIVGRVAKESIDAGVMLRPDMVEDA